MFKNRSIQVRVIKDDKTETPRNTGMSPNQYRDLEKINDLIKDNVKTVAIAAIGIYAAVTALNTASEIAVNAAPKR